LRATRPDDLAAIAIQGALGRVPNLDQKEVEDVIIGCAMPEAEQGMNVARIASLRAGLPIVSSAMTINRFCSSGLQSIALAAGPPSGIALVTAPPSTARSRVPLTVQPSVQLQDASGNALAQAGIEVKASIVSGGGTLGGQTSVLTNGNGRADFTDLAITGAPGPRTLRFASQSRRAR